MIIPGTKTRNGYNQPHGDQGTVVLTLCHQRVEHCYIATLLKERYPSPNRWMGQWAEQWAEQ